MAYYRDDEKHDINYYIKKGIYRGGVTTNRRYHNYTYNNYKSSSYTTYKSAPNYSRSREIYRNKIEEQQEDQMKKDEVWYGNYLNVVKIFKSKKRKHIKGLAIEHPLYTENHHIKPVCVGGTDEESNFVRVSKDEHKVLHILLCKSYPNNDKLYTAIMKMTYGDTLLEENMYLRNYTADARSYKMDELLEEMIKKSVIDKNCIKIN